MWQRLPPTTLQFVSMWTIQTERNRLTVAFRLDMIIPILIVLSLLSRPGFGSPGDSESGDNGMRFERNERRGMNGDSASRAAVAGGGILVAPTLLMLLVCRKYPRWWFDWNREITRFSSRVTAYGGLLRDEYPSTDEEQSVHLDVDYPDAQQLNRWLPLVKWFLAIPHYIVLLFLGFAVVLVTIFAWFAILLTGRYTRGLFDFVVGVQLWGLRVTGYAFLLVTDRYPPFSMR